MTSDPGGQPTDRDANQRNPTRMSPTPDSPDGSTARSLLRSVARRSRRRGDSTRDGDESGFLDRAPEALATASRRVERALRAASFWTAVVLPFLYVPVVLDGLRTAGRVWVVLGAVLLNVLALGLGHSHRRDDGGR